MGKDAFLYIGGSYPQIPGYEQIKSLGIHLAVTDRNPNAVAKEYADTFFVCDALDKNKILEFSKKIASDYKLIGAYGVADYAYETIGQVCDTLKLNYASLNCYKSLINKQFAKAQWIKYGINTPKLFWSGNSKTTLNNSILNEISDYKVMLKPVGSNGSAGLTYLKNPKPEQTLKAVSNLLDEYNHILIDQYVEGDIWNADGLMIDGDFFPVSITERKSDEDLPFLSSRQIQPPMSSPEEYGRYFNLAKNAAKALSYENGPLTIDFINNEDQLHVLEISPHYHALMMDNCRGNQGLLTSWVAYLSGDKQWKKHLISKNSEWGGCYMLRAKKCGAITNIHGIDEAKIMSQALNIRCMKSIGDVVESINDSRGICAVAWISGKSRREIDDAFSLIEKTVKFRIN